MNTEQIMALADSLSASAELDGANSVSDSKSTLLERAALQSAIEALVQERDAFDERLTVQAHRVAHWIEKHDDIKASRDEYQREADKLAAENKALRDALKDMLDGNDKSFRELCRQARAALQGANHE
jgi:FtsZ-binding cell division protein ZapB